MIQFSNILLIAECDAGTLERAALLAKEHHAQLTILMPLKELPGGAERLVIGDRRVDVRTLVAREYKTRLEELAESVRARGASARTRLAVGEPSVEVIRDVLARGRDLVIMTAEGKGGIVEWLFGSLATHLMRKCPSPLLVMKPGRRKRFQNVLAAIDPHSTDADPDSLNAKILQLAVGMAQRDGARLHVAHAWSLFGEGMLREQGGLPAEEIDRAVQVEAARHRRSVERLLAQQAIRPAKIHLLKGEPGKMIPKLVADWEIDLLVMGTVCRTGIPGFIIGNTAERVLDVVACSVLVVKPPGFVSPVSF